MKIKTTLLTGALLLTAQIASAGPFDYSCTDCPQLIPADGTTSGVTVSTLTVAETGTIADLSVFVDATHTFSGDLIITLEHDGVSVVLADLVGSLDDYVPTLYGSLADFVGGEINGTWTLTIEDVNGGDSGTLFDWNIFGNLDMGPMGAPEPGILILMGLGLAGLGFARRRS